MPMTTMGMMTAVVMTAIVMATVVVPTIVMAAAVVSATMMAAVTVGFGRNGQWHTKSSSDRNAKTQTSQHSIFSLFISSGVLKLSLGGNCQLSPERDGGAL